MLTTKVEVNFQDGIFKTPLGLVQDKNVTLAEVLRNYNSQDVLLFDLRTRREYEDYHVPGSILLPLEELETRYKEIPKNKTVYLICRTGNRTAQALRYLLTRGYRKAYNVLNGIVEWEGPLEGDMEDIAS